MEILTNNNVVTQNINAFSSIGLKNFRKFATFRWLNVKEANAITGFNGSGKTTILWAILLFCRGYNTLYKGSTSKHLSSFDVSVLLNFPALTNLPRLSDFFGIGTVIACTISGIEYTCTITYDSHITISPPPADTKEQRIRYAYVGIDTAWVGLPTMEAGVINSRDFDQPLSSGISNIRTRYRSLRNSSKVSSRVPCVNIIAGQSRRIYEAATWSSRNYCGCKR